MQTWPSTSRTTPTSSSRAASPSPGTPIESRATTRCVAPTWVTEERRTVERFIQVVIDGIATGSIYAALALALVLIYRSTGIVNFAQGEMAMFSTFVAWGLTEAGIAVGFAILITLALSFVGGMVIERALIRPVEGGQELTLVVVTLGLFIFVNGLARWIWGS